MLLISNKVKLCLVTGNTLKELLDASGRTKSTAASVTYEFLRSFAIFHLLRLRAAAVLLSEIISVCSFLIQLKAMNGEHS